VQGGLSGVGGGCGAADGGAESGEQLVHAEGFGDVVVGAGVECFGFVDGVGAGGQHDDGDGGPAAESCNDVGAVDVGEAQVEHDDVGFGVGGDFQGCGSVVCGEYLVAVGGEVDAQGADELGVVV